MRVTGWRVGTNNEEEEFSFLSESPANNSNWITMVVGRNGTKKSLLLRGLLDAFLGNTEFRHGIRPAVPTAIRFAPNASVKDRAIAISGTPFDRFPRQNRFSWPQANSGKYDNIDNYYYLGLSSANGSIGPTHNVRTLAHLLFRTQQDDKKLSIAITRFLKFSGFHKGIYVVLKRAPVINNSKKDVAESAENILGKFSYNNFQNQLDLKIQTAPSKETAKGLRSIARKLRGEKYRVNMISTLSQMAGASFGFLFNGNGLKIIHNDKIQVPADDIVELLESGLLIASHVASDIELRRESDEVEMSTRNVSGANPASAKKSNLQILTETDMSSGQWQLFSSMLGLALTITDNTLVVIDEPENSLHPDWQRSYVQLLSEVISHRKGCHVVIATHSPLIASGIDIKNGNAIRMLRNPSSAIIGESEPVTISFGWNANDVYNEIFGLETPRASKFTELADKTLSLLRDRRIESEELKKNLDELVDIAKSLPDNDSMRLVIFSMQSAYQSIIADK